MFIQVYWRPHHYKYTKRVWCYQSLKTLLFGFNLILSLLKTTFTKMNTKLVWFILFKCQSALRGLYPKQWLTADLFQYTEYYSVSIMITKMLYPTGHEVSILYALSFIKHSSSFLFFPQASKLNKSKRIMFAGIGLIAFHQRSLLAKRNYRYTPIFLALPVALTMLKYFISLSRASFQTFFVKWNKDKNNPYTHILSSAG